ncbi:P-loop containing nucleoside triphosphate hydrolases superfamily protein isoform 1 [Hibiscus syriacus]|uniref:P-loop containing nucleoside triphosphate hydrolases superfamily protein isoform 1 n=1 Tax=Hibiscus syriacus TaxID=106335 RepID=A0A6A3AEH4_HIBSY|nr:precursor of CEP5-like [Hibiscus syriacus]KAE8701209.1 P-loop containing nucleoside triphosphate hydrolases superfamily protein isoform 1 [Hibiscus syriacus]
MAQNNLLSILLLLSLVFFLEIQCIAGRQLILDQNQVETRATLDPKTNAVSVNTYKTKSPPSPPTVVNGARENQSPPPKSHEDFRPTSPGHSPGVGHSVQN